MTANECTPQDGENVSDSGTDTESDSDRWHYFSENCHGSFYCDYAGGDWDGFRGRVEILHSRENSGKVTIASAGDSDDWHADLVVNLSPDQARKLAQDLIEQAEFVEPEEQATNGQN